MESLDYWRLCEELNIFQAALLLVGCNPSDVNIHNDEYSEMCEIPREYKAAEVAIIGALRKEKN